MQLLASPSTDCSELKSCQGSQIAKLTVTTISIADLEQETHYLAEIICLR